MPDSNFFKAYLLQNKAVLAAIQGEAHQARSLGEQCIALCDEGNIQSLRTRMKDWLENGCQPIFDLDYWR